VDVFSEREQVEMNLCKQNIETSSDGERLETIQWIVLAIES